MGYSGGSFGVAHKPHNRQCLTTYSAASISSSAIASFRSVATRLVRHAFVPSGSFLLACDSRKRLSDRARTRSAGCARNPVIFIGPLTTDTLYSPWRAKLRGCLAGVTITKCVGGILQVYESIAAILNLGRSFARRLPTTGLNEFSHCGAPA